MLVKINSLIYEDYICYYFMMMVTSHTYVCIRTIFFYFIDNHGLLGTTFYVRTLIHVIRVRHGHWILGPVPTYVDIELIGGFRVLEFVRRIVRILLIHLSTKAPGFVTRIQVTLTY